MNSRRSLLLTLLLAPLCAAKPPADMQARLEAFVKEQPGGIAAAWVDAEGTALFSAGKFAADDARPITPDTQIEIGSVTKVFRRRRPISARIRRRSLKSPTLSCLRPSNAVSSAPPTSSSLRSEVNSYVPNNHPRRLVPLGLSPVRST